MPDPIDTQDFSATPFGVICIGVDWTDPNNIEIRGPPTDLSFFVIINGSSSDPLTVNVGKNYEILLHDYTTVEPGDIYDIEVNLSTYMYVHVAHTFSYKSSCDCCVYNTVHVLMRDEKEGRKKQARSNKQHRFGVWCLWWFHYPGLLLHTELMVSLFIRCTMRCEIWAQPAELPRAQLVERSV